MGFIQDFKKFATKGNVIDMTVGIIVGGGFGKVVTSLVNDIIMPPLGLIIGGVDFKDLKWVLKPEVMENGQVITPTVSFNYGAFIQNIVDFLIIALTIFILIKVVSKVSKKKEAEPAAPPKQEVLLEEIRDLLKQK